MRSSIRRAGVLKSEWLNVDIETTTVVFVHGMFEPWTVWEKMAVEIAKDESVRCVTLDLRDIDGYHNLSRTIRGDAENVASAVKALKGDVVFVAHSYGCLVTLLALMDESIASRVKGVILLAPVLGRSFPFEFWKRLALGPIAYGWPILASLVASTELRLTDADARALINVHGECTDEEANELYGEFEAEPAALCREFAFFAPRVKISPELVGRIHVYAGEYDVIATSDDMTGALYDAGAILKIGSVNCGHILPLSAEAIALVKWYVKRFVQ